MLTGWPPGLDLADPVRAGVILLALELLFLGRVVGQLIVATRSPAWLPPMAEWYSGVLPYRKLVASQVVSLGLMSLVVAALLARSPWILEPRPALGTGLLVTAWIYALSMVLRYVVRMARHPEARWVGRTIPIVFHIVLAGWLFVLGSYLRSA